MLLGEVERDRQVQHGRGHSRQSISGRIFFILSHNHNSLLAPDHLWTSSPQLSPILWGSPEGNCTALGHQWGYHKTQINSQGVFPLLGKGRGCVSAATSRILQLNHAMPGNLCRMERSWIKCPWGVHALLCATNILFSQDSQLVNCVF